MDKQRILNYALIAVLALLVIQMFSRGPEQQPGALDDLVIQASAEVKTGSAVILGLSNNTAEEITFESECPGEPFNVSRYVNGKWVAQGATTESCSTEALVLQPQESATVSYQHWQGDLFTEPGKYRIEIPQKEKVFFHEFEITRPGAFGKIWRTLVYRPIYNGLIALTKLAGSSFGWGIVLLTLALRLILFMPFQKSLKSQRKLQKIQPEIDAIKKRFEGNQQMIAMETMALMKKHKVSPLGSCLPILIQMPFLIALFWATRDGLGENNFIHLYGFLQNFDFTVVTTNFFGLDLIAPGAQLYFALPIFLAVAQFGQMKLALHHSHKKAKAPGENPMADAMQSMSKMMPYFLPIIIALLSASIPAAVGLNWGVSTLFGVGQQLVVNRQIK